MKTTQAALSELLKIAPERLFKTSRETGEYKIELEGVLLTLKETMPITDNGLLRVGRHLWLVNWQGETGSATQLTQKD
jgi:hypothetical protein